MNEPDIITVKELLQTDGLQIPNYQRPYKWTEKNVNQLIDDVLFHKDKSEYRLGTVVVHKEDGEEKFNIVDGQQRTITLVLIIYALMNNKKLNNIKGLSGFRTKLTDLRFSNDISKANIQNNYKAIERRIDEFEEASILFLFNNCKLVKVVIGNISEAFQFFDSQNARGKDLEPHDLLKAFHLREMNNFSTEEEMQKIVGNWEEMDTDKLSKLFAFYLYRIRNWSNGRSAKYFTKNEIEVFKGISLDVEEIYPFAKIFRIAHYYTEAYNQSQHSKINQCNFDYPFQIDQTIINGKRFFEMVSYYDKLIDKINDDTDNKIINLINEYQKNGRTGDQYINNLFYCGLIYYIDKFGEKNLARAIDKIFVWAYTLRLKLHNVGLDSVDNYALCKAYSQVQLFQKIREAISPNDILNIQLEVLRESTELKGRNIKGIYKIVNVFRERKYYE